MILYTMGHILKQFLIAIDQTINTLVYIPGDGWGYADEMISARVFRCYLQNFISDTPMKLVNTLFFWDDDHCYECWAIECTRNQLPNNYSN